MDRWELIAIEILWKFFLFLFVKGSIYYRYLLEGTLKKEREKLGIRGNISGG